MIADTVGPMGALAIAAGAFVKASAGAALNAQRMAEALKASDGAERLRQQFEQILGSAAAAKRQVEMLAKVASGSAFSFDSLADASKNLQVLTNGALNSEKALKKVQDVAAATGAPVDTMATAVADLYNALKTGDGVEAASGQLKNMGAISDETAQKLRSLNASGVGLATTWQVVEADLNRANGAASALGGTIAGLQQQLANIQQGSDTKIGEMFAEGEKAGYRAAIGFKKFTAAVEEANAGPWSALFGAINSIKEAVGGMLGAFAETGAVKTIFQALGVAAIAILGGINITIVALIVQLGKLTAKLLVTRTAVAALSAAAKGFAALWSGATIGLTAFVAVLGTMIALGGRAASSVKELKGQIKEFNAESNKGTGKARGMVMTASSPEERDAAEKYLEEQIANTRSGIEQGKKDLTQAREDKRSLDPFRRKAGGINEVQAEGAIQQGEIALQGLIGLQEVLNQRARDGGIAAFDQKRLEVAQKRADLEKDIAERARERIQASATPENAAKMAAAQKAKAEEELKYAEEATKNRKEDDKMLDKASKDFQKSKQERLDYSPLEEAGRNSVSESGKLQAEMAKREAMKQELADAIDKGDSVRRGKVEAEIMSLKNPLTGASEEYDANDPAKALGTGMQRLKFDLQAATEKEDEIAKRAGLENATIGDQQAQEAQAADQAATEAGQRKLNIQKQLAALQGMEGGDGKAAEAELEPEIAQLKKKQEAVKALKEAEDAYNAARQSGDKGKIAEAEANYNQRRTDAFGAGMKVGDTPESVNQEVQATQNILNIRQQQAAIEQAAAQRRRDDLMNEMKMTNQITQLRLARTETKMGENNDRDKTERDVKLDDLKRKQGDLEKAGAVLAERDAAIKAGDGKMAMDKKKELEALGVDGNASAEDLRTKLAQNRDEQQNVKAQQVLQRKGYEDDTKIAIARTKEDYGVTREERESGRNERRAAEDEKMKKSLKEDYENNQGMDSDEAENMADLETRKQRLLADDVEAGTPRVDSLTAIGGGATGSVGPVKDVQQEIKQINEEMKNLLQEIIKRTDEQMSMVQQYQPDSPG
jgi:hypothetical protein